LWLVARRAALIFVISEMVLFVVLQFVFGAPLLLTAFAMVLGAGGVAGLAIRLAFDIIKVDRAVEREQSDRYARDFLTEVHRQGPRPPGPPA
jgi:O-antigen ligase